MNTHYIDPIVKILTKVSVLQFLLNLSISCCDHANVYRDILITTKPAELIILEHVEQLSLKRRMHFANLVKEDRPMIGELKFPGFSGHRACKRPLFISE